MDCSAHISFVLFVSSLFWVRFKFGFVGSFKSSVQTQSHTLGTVGMATKHSKTPVNHLKMTESAASLSFKSFSHQKQFVSLKRVLVYGGGRTDGLGLGPLFLLFLIFFIFIFYSFQSQFLSVSQSEQRRLPGSSTLSSSAHQNGFQIKFSLCCDQAIKTPGRHQECMVSSLIACANISYFTHK